jgi:hypothetical protein
MRFWFGFCTIIQPYAHLAPGLWKPMGNETSLLFGLFFLLIGGIGMARPRELGLFATFPVCAARGVQGIETGNYYALGVWVALAVISSWAVLRRERELRLLIHAPRYPHDREGREHGTPTRQSDTPPAHR